MVANAVNSCVVEGAATFTPAPFVGLKVYFAGVDSVDEAPNGPNLIGQEIGRRSGPVDECLAFQR